MNLRNLFFQSALNYKDQTAFQIKQGKTYKKFSYSEAGQKILSLADHLLSLGIKKGDCVAILSENRPEWAISYLAIASIAAVVVPLDIMLHKSDILPLLKDCGAKAIILSSRGGEILGEELNQKRIKIESIESLTEIKSAEFLNQIPLQADDLAAILYTSGTTGSPKGVMLSHKNIMSNVLAVSEIFSVGPKDNFLSILPLHHAFEATAGFLCPFYNGVCITYAESLKSYNLLANMKETGVTIMCGVPLLYKLFLDGIKREVEAKGRGMNVLFNLLLILARIIPLQSFRRKLFSTVHKSFGGRVRFWVSGGAAIDPEVIKGFSLLGIPILQGYGLTESSPILNCNTPKCNKVGSVGRNIPGVEVRIEPRHGVAIPEGEVLARGPSIMSGYYKRPDITSQVLKDGWLYTGDIGRIDSKGFLYITGRCKDVIVTGSGVNVFPEELEFLLMKVKDVKDVCVVGAKVKDGIRAGTEQVIAILVPEEGKEIEEDDIYALNGKLPEFKRIARVIIRKEEFPKTTTRKIKKYQVKKEMGLL
ncbi:MAG: AMP-binding protein [Candidatus Saganbacteria bacterium]|nr:AMP-binding protein [Candidatus Saganbacteria bacterium]